MKIPVFIISIFVLGLIIGISVIKENNANIINETSSKGNILYVGGSGPNNYTSIQDAINDANDGDTIFVYSGVYYENIIINKRINLVGEDKETTIIDGGLSEDVVNITADWVNIEKLFLKNSGWQSKAGVKVFANNCTVADCNIQNNQYGIYIFFKKPKECGI